MKNKKRFIDSKYGDSFIKQEKNKLDIPEYQKAQFVIKNHIQKMQEYTLKYEEWTIMYDLLYAFAPYQLFINGINEYALAIHNVNVLTKSYEELIAYNTKLFKLYDDLKASKLIDDEKNKKL